MVILNFLVLLSTSHPIIQSTMIKVNLDWALMSTKNNWYTYRTLVYYSYYFTVTRLVELKMSESNPTGCLISTILWKLTIEGQSPSPLMEVNK